VSDGAGAIIFQRHIRTHRKAVNHRLPFLAFEVDRKAALVAVEGSEETGAEPAKSTGMVTVGRGLDLDHVGAEPCRCPARCRVPACWS